MFKKNKNSDYYFETTLIKKGTLEDFLEKEELSDTNGDIYIIENDTQTTLLLSHFKEHIFNVNYIKFLLYRDKQIKAITIKTYSTEPKEDIYIFLAPLTIKELLSNRKEEKL